MDKNQIIGLVLIGAMLLGYTLYTRETTPPITTQTEQVGSTTSTAGEEKITSSDSLTVVGDSANNGGPTSAPEKTYLVENDDIKAVFSDHGGYVKSIELKKYTTYLGDNIILFDHESSQLEFTDGDVELHDHVHGFSTNLKEKTRIKSTDTLSFSFSAEVGGEQVTHTYRIGGTGFEIWHTIKIDGRKERRKPLIVDWSYNLKKFEDDVSYSRNQSWINYYSVSGDYDEIVDSGTDEEQLDASLKWFSMKNRFFNSGIISENSQFQRGFFKSVQNDADTSHIKWLHASAELPINSKDGAHVAELRYYFGPNDYHILEHVTDEYENNVYMGWGVFGLVNEWGVLPLFNFLEDFIPSYGLIILILVIIVKMILFPIAYRSYLSMAKMRELKPEIDAIKAENDGDQQKSQQATMKLYQQAGVNPLAGCIPMVLQMPVLLALFNFFPNCIELRHQSFLWAHDLSTYDNVIQWGTPIFGFDHISIFTLLMTVSTIGYTYLNNQTNAQAQGPMKMMSYLMPLVFFFVLNSYSAGLTFYYFVSNLITISQQLIATKFIDKEKIRLTIEENRKAASTGNKKQSKFQARLQEAMKAGQENRKNGNK